MDNKTNYITTCGKRLEKTPHEYGPVARDVYILHYVISGKGYLEFGDKHITIEKGQSFIIRPFLSVHYYCDQEDPWQYVWINFRGNEFDKIVNSINFLKENCVIGHVDPKYILPFANIIYKEYMLENRKIFCNNLLKSILGIYIDIYPLVKGNYKAQKFTEATKLISENYQNSNFFTKHISNQLGISSSSLYRLFIEFAGISPNRYLINYRITMAKNFIDSGMKIKEAAQACGYDDPLYFSRIFRLITSVSPKYYSRQNRYIGCKQETYVYKNKK